MLKKTIGAFAVTLACTSVHAETVSVVQTFTNVEWSDYGVASGLGYGQKVTGDWIFKGIADTDSPNLSTWPSGSFVLPLKNVTLTQSFLGLVDEPILNLNYLSIFSTFIAFDVSASSGSVWTRTSYDNQIDAHGAFPLTANTVLISPSQFSNGFGPQWSGFELANGSKIYGYAFGGSSTIQISAIPEPSSPMLVLSGIVGLACFAHRKRHTRPEVAG